MAEKGRTRTNYDLRFWLWCNYEVVSKGRLFLEEIVADYNAIKNNLTFHLHRKEVGKTLRELFGATITSKRITKKRRSVFLNLGRKSETINKTEDFIVGCVYGGSWTMLSKKSESTYEFAKFSGIKINESLYIGKLCVCNPATGSIMFTLTSPFRDQPLTDEDLGCMDASIGISSLLHFLDRFVICSGIEADERTDAVVRNPETETKFVKVNIDGKNVFVSSKCRQLTTSLQPTCADCKFVKRNNLDRRKAEYSDIMLTKNELLSREELQQKMGMILEAKNNAQSQVRYWKNKYQRECTVVGDMDNKDYTKMLKKINHDELDDDLRQLVQHQRKCLEKKSTKGYNWHPRIIQLLMDKYRASSKDKK